MFCRVRGLFRTARILFLQNIGSDVFRSNSIKSVHILFLEHMISSDLFQVPKLFKLNNSRSSWSSSSSPAEAVDKGGGLHKHRRSKEKMLTLPLFLKAETLQSNTPSPTPLKLLGKSCRCLRQSWSGNNTASGSPQQSLNQRSNSGDSTKITFAVLRPVILPLKNASTSTTLPPETQVRPCLFLSSACQK